MGWSRDSIAFNRLRGPRRVEKTDRHRSLMSGPSGLLILEAPKRVPKQMARPLCRNVSGGFLLYKFWRILPGIFLEDFSGPFFPRKWGEKIRRENPRKNPAAQKQKSTKNPFCQKPTLTKQMGTKSSSFSKLKNLKVILTTPTPHISKKNDPKICHKIRRRMA